MNIALTPEQRKFVEQKVRAGTFGSAADVVREAVELFRMQETISGKDIAELRRAAAIGIAELDRGDFEEFNAADIKSLGRRVLAARKASPRKSPRKRTA